MTVCPSDQDEAKKTPDVAAAMPLESILESKRCLPQAIHKLADALQAVASAQSLDPEMHPRSYQGWIAGALARMREAEAALTEAIDHADRAQQD